MERLRLVEAEEDSFSLGDIGFVEIATEGSPTKVAVIVSRIGDGEYAVAVPVPEDASDVVIQQMQNVTSEPPIGTVKALVP